jgi:hypothetical protein
LPRLWPPSGGLKLPQLAGPCQQMRLSFFQTVIDPFGSEILPLERYSRRQSSFNGMSEQRRVSANPNRVTRPNPTSLEISIDQLLLWGCLTRGATKGYKKARVSLYLVLSLARLPLFNLPSSAHHLQNGSKANEDHEAVGRWPLPTYGDSQEKAWGNYFPNLLMLPDADLCRSKTSRRSLEPWLLQPRCAWSTTCSSAC